MALDVIRQRVGFAVAPLFHRRRPILQPLGGRAKTGAGRARDIDGHHLAAALPRPARFVQRCARSVHALAEHFADFFLHQKRAIAAHVFQRAQRLRRSSSGQAGHAVLEDPAVVLLHCDALPRAVRRFEHGADPQAAICIDSPRQANPELVFFPDFARVGLISPLDLFAVALAMHAQHRLTKSNPARRMSFLALDVVAFRAVAHRQHIVSEDRRLAPSGCHGHMQAH